jgi:hypothetical protein
MTEPRDAEAIGEDDGPSLEDAKEALDAHTEEPDPDAPDLPTDVKDGEAGDGT